MSAVPLDSRPGRSAVVAIAAGITAFAASGYGVWIYRLDLGAFIFGLLVLLCVAPGFLFFPKMRDPAFLRTVPGIALFVLCAYLSMVLCASTIALARGDASQLADLKAYPMLFLMVVPPTTLMLLLVWGLDRALDRWREARR